MPVRRPFVCLSIGAILAVAIASCDTSADGLTGLSKARVTVTPDTATLTALGATRQFVATSDGPVTWASTNEAVATVDTQGRVTARGTGTARIVATSTSSNGADTASVTVVQRPARLTLTPATIVLYVGDTLTVYATLADANGFPIPNVPVTWTSTDPATVTVENGIVRGLAAGQTTITAAAGGLTATLPVRVDRPVSAMFTIVGGDNQTAPVTSTLPLPLSVRVVDQAGTPVAGVPVTWVVDTATGGTAVPTTSMTDADGIATTRWTLGATAGPQALTAQAPGQPDLHFHAMATAGAPARVLAVSGDAQRAQAGTTLPTPLIVQVVDAHDNPVPGVTVTWAAAPGNGSLDATTVTTDADGRASVRWTLGLAAGPQTVHASIAESSTPVTFQATATPVVVATVTVSPATATLRTLGATVTLSATAQDSSGAPITGLTPTWTTSNSAVATVNPMGVVTAIGVGTATITATMNGTAGTAVVTVTTAPLITNVTPTTVTPGSTATIDGLNFAASPAGNTVTLGGVAVSVTAASATRLTVTIPARTAFPAGCLPTQAMPLVVTTTTGTATRAQPVATAPQQTLAIGQGATLTSATELGCLELSQSGHYLLTVTNTAPSPSAMTSVEVAGTTGHTEASPSIIAHQPWTRPMTRVVTPRTSRSFLSVNAHDPHIAALEAARALAERARRVGRLRHAPTPRASLRRTTAAASLSVAPAIGDLMTFAIPDAWDGSDVSAACDSARATMVTARVVYAGPRVAILEDTSWAMAGQVDTTFQRFGQTWDAVIDPMLTTYFGDPLAVDASLGGTGKVFLLFSPTVNSFGAGLQGFVWPNDLIQLNGCLTNSAALAYLRVPDGSNDVNWGRSMAGTIAHEGKHIVSVAERLARGGVFEDVWLEEGTAQLATELYARSVYGYGQNDNTTYAQSVGAELSRGGPYAALYLFTALYSYIDRPETASPLSNAGDFPYGVTWLLARWIIDQSGQPEAAVTRAFVQDATRHGIANLEARAGRPFADLIADFDAALVVDDTPGMTPERRAWTFPSWSVHDILAHESSTDGLPPMFLGSGDFRVTIPAIAGGSSTYVDVVAAPGTSALLQIQAPGGGAPASTVRATLVRVP